MRSVLVVDDEPNVRSLVRDVLELSGYQVREASNGDEALTAVDAQPPDCVVLDVMMPGLSGIDVLAELRRRPSHDSLPVLLLSAADDDQATWAGWRAGASCYLTKPFDPDVLTAWLLRLSAEVA
jgi:two-component system phosphate regulon response regulator PhoB